MRRYGFAKVRVAVWVLLLTVAGGTGWAQLVPLLPPSESEQPEESTPQLSRSVQIVQDDLAAGRFDALDALAQRVLHNKGRNPGGGWKLDAFFSALDPRKPTEAATAEHMAQLERWIAAKPSSMTARVAMAKSLNQWAWVARGSGVADTVTPAMAKLFFERIERSQRVLEDSEKLEPMFPEWYGEMMTVGLAQGWDRAKMQDLFDRATKFEPGYFQFYRAFANYLLPKWEGEPGDATSFAKAAADRVGGDDGDVIYFEFATIVIKRGNGGIPTTQMDWERIKRGAYALEKKYGQSRTTMNQFAFMAYKYRDAVVAGPLFAEIGDRWVPAVWKEKSNYDQARNWAARHSEGSAAGE
jgi:hypothetical protein